MYAAHTLHLGARTLALIPSTCSHVVRVYDVLRLRQVPNLIETVIQWA